MPAKTIDAELFNARVPNGRRWLLWFLYKVLWRTVFGLVIGLRYVWAKAPHPDGPVIYIANHNSHLDRHLDRYEFADDHTYNDYCHVVWNYNAVSKHHTKHHANNNSHEHYPARMRRVSIWLV